MPTTALWATVPLLDRLSQQTTASGPAPAARRAARASTSRPSGVVGCPLPDASSARSAATSGAARVQAAVGAEAVGGLGDGQGDHGGGGGGDQRREPCDVGAVHGFHNAADGRERVPAVGALHHGVQPVLLGEGQGGVGAAPGEGGDAPVRGIARLVGVPGLVRAVEGAQAQVDDPHGCLGGRAQCAVEPGKFHGGSRSGSVRMCSSMLTV